jgi:hypothetical protein
MMAAKKRKEHKASRRLSQRDGVAAREVAPIKPQSREERSAAKPQSSRQQQEPRNTRNTRNAASGEIVFPRIARISRFISLAKFAASREQIGLFHCGEDQPDRNSACIASRRLKSWAESLSFCVSKRNPWPGAERT